MSMVPDITTTPAWPNVPEGINSKGRVSGDIEKVSPGRSRRRPTCRSFSFASASTQLGATPEARRWGTRAAAGLARPGTSGNRGWCLGRRPQTAERERSTRQRRQRVCTDSFCVFPFLGRGAETRCLCCRGAGLFLCAGQPQNETGSRHRGQPRRAMETSPPQRLPPLTATKRVFSRSGMRIPSRRPATIFDALTTW